MRTTALVGLLGVLWLAPQRTPDPFIPIGVWYGGPGVAVPDVSAEPWTHADTWRRDLDAIRAAGFNSVTTWTTWAHAEPIEGRYRFDALEQMLRLASDTGLRVTLEVFADPAPTWHKRPPCAAGSPVSGIITAVSTRALAHASFAGLATPVVPRKDGCLDTLALAPKPAGRPALSPAELGLALDLMRTGTAQRGWRLSRLQAVRDVSRDRNGPEVTDADLRLWTWAALARGARAVAFDHWHRMQDDAGGPSRAARAAGAVAANITRNMRLFASLTPRPARVAILHTGEAPPSAVLYRAAFDRNIPIDFVQPVDLLSGAASRYGTLLVEREQPAVVRQALKVFETAGGQVLTDPAAPAEIPPDIHIDGAPGLVEARFLESLDTWLIVAINHADTPQKATLGFGTDIPEAIWVDMEAGTSFTFVQSAAGPALTHTFPARDVLVLVRSKKLR